jgi:hypothetical protein
MDLLMLWAASFVLCSMAALFGVGVKVLINAWKASRKSQNRDWTI